MEETLDFELMPFQDFFPANPSNTYPLCYFWGTNIDIEGSSTCKIIYYIIVFMILYMDHYILFPIFIFLDLVVRKWKVKKYKIKFCFLLFSIFFLYLLILSDWFIARIFFFKFYVLWIFKMASVSLTFG
jgi:hypothetical protein